MRNMHRIFQAADGVYGIDSSFVMSWLVIGKTGAILIDTAYGFEDLAAVVRNITPLPVTVINSHGHVDHTGGNFFFDTPVCIHEADVEVYERHNQPQVHRHIEKSLRSVNRLVFWRRLVPRHPKEYDKKRARFSNWRLIHEGDLFDLGDLTAEIVEIPGHTRGSVAVYFPEKRLMVTSDGACPNPYLFLPESATLSTYIQSLKKLKGYSIDTILTGHSRKMIPGSELDAWLHVAEYPDTAHGNPWTDEGVAPGIRQITCWATDDPKHKGPSIVLDPNKIDVDGNKRKKG